MSENGKQEKTYNDAPQRSHEAGPPVLAKTAEEVLAAHELLRRFATHPASPMRQSDAVSYTVSAFFDAMCWMLGHDNPSAQGLLDRITDSLVELDQMVEKHRQKVAPALETVAPGCTQKRGECPCTRCDIFRALLNQGASPEDLPDDLLQTLEGLGLTSQTVASLRPGLVVGLASANAVTREKKKK